MITLDDISMAVIVLIRAGAVFRFIYCMVRLQGAEEEQAQYKKRVKNTVMFYVMAESLFGGAIAALLWLFAGNVALTVVAVLSGIFGSVMMCTKDQNNQSVVDQIGNMVRFWRSQQIFPYRMIDEWGMKKGA